MPYKELITTVITTYKRPLLLKRAVNSVLQQTYPHFQISVYDNNSDDGTEELMQEFARQDKRVKYHRHPTNIGMMANYEYAFANIKTPYFSMLSDDDYLMPCFFETAIKSFEEYPKAAFVACGVGQNDGKDIVWDPLSAWKREGCYEAPDGVLEMLSSYNTLPLPTGILFQSKSVKDITPDWSEVVQLRWDSDYLLQISAQYPCVINKKLCAIFSLHENSFTGAFFSEMKNAVKLHDKYLKASERMLNRLIANPSVSDDSKIVIKEKFLKMLRNETSYHMYRYIVMKNNVAAIELMKIFQDYYPIDKKQKLLGLLARLNNTVLFQPVIGSCFLILRTLIHFYRRVKDINVRRR